ncbi:bifunctional copper resistance protein CopD/cytochrome c oxidase assembly protein [Cellulosimicrobium sp. CUA-896]|uniref:bifunctional copper resistance protein CopD/cytochrome c oxidase assembly protein n=1 Tax=Cellulosimicrobium sp. CUA-896 TaxID=1517881 RepID=UPI00095EF778|nr:bifunctional copper resistance protein CopD/cytochrome c oxidase assembly protein [Cellulosimicrobium sp. CUA-896]OLT54574.1 copper resistance protein CopD [Cellulosimicrobium sp. CUA-896]
MTTTAVRRAPSGAARPANPWWLVLAGPTAVVVAVLAVLAAGAYSSAFAAVPGFSDPGALARLGTPVVTVLTELSVALTVGSLVLAACVLAPGEPVRRALGLAGVASGTWAVLAVVQLVLRYSVISGTPVPAATFGDQLGLFVSQVGLGRNYLLVVVVAAATSAFALAVRGATGALWTAVLALVAVAAQANTGHAAGAASHELAVSSMFLHLAGAALWVGGLGTLAVVRVRGGLGRDGLGRDGLASAVARYSAIALWCYVAVALSGVVNASIRVEDLADLGTDYGVLLLVKVALIVVLGVVGFAHRELVVRRLSGQQKVRDAGARRAAEATGWLFWRLVAVELAIMGAVSGVAVALGSTAPPVPDDEVLDATPAEIVTGHPLPPEPTLARWFTEWRWDLLPAFACGAALVVYLVWVRRLARRGDRWPLGRTASWCAGIVVLFWVTSGGPATYGHVLFSAHMVQHMILAMLVPVFLVLAAPVTLLVRAVPPRKDGSRGPREWVLAVVTSRVGQFFANPVVAAVNFAGSMIVFYYTPAFELALTTYVGHLAMILHFTLAGYLFANALVGIDPGPHRPGYPQRLLLLFATMAFHAFFGVALTSGEVLLVPEWFGLLGREWGPTAIEDQQRGGGVAWGIGELPTLSLAIIVAVMWTRSDEREARRRDRQADRDGDAELTEYNAMLAKMAERDDRP